MKKILSLLVIFLFLTSCGGKNIGGFGKGVNITFDPRTVGVQIDDTIMQKNLSMDYPKMRFMHQLMPKCFK